MIKKISAVILALVLCFSVVVLPASAGFDADYTLPEGKSIAYKVELDKANYNAGDTVTVKVYLNVASNIETHTGSLLFGVNSDVFDTSVNAADTVKATATSNAAFQSFYNEITGLNWAWQRDAIKSRLEAANTPAENEAYNEYLKVVLTRNLSGSHPNAGLNTNGLPGTDINGDSDPFITFQLKLRDDIPDGTPINIAITSGAITCVPAQTAFKVFKDGSTSNVWPATSEYDVSAAVATATVGTPAPAGPVVAKSKAEVKMTPNSPTTVEDAFQFRVTSVITDADWDTYFANTAAGGNNAITKLGFVAYKGTDGFDLETAKSVAKGGSAAGYDVATTTYVQKADDSSDAYFGAIIQITSAETRSDATYIAYVEYTDAEGATQYAFYDAAQTALLDTNYQTIVDSYLDAYPFAG